MNPPDYGETGFPLPRAFGVRRESEENNEERNSGRDVREVQYRGSD